MKRVLMLASVASMIDQFNMPNLELLQQLGYEVHVACNFENGNTCNHQSICELKDKLNKLKISYFHIDFARNILDLKQNIKAYREISVLLKENQYTFIHCHSPIGGVIGRIAAVRTKTKVIYTAHGFHFYEGAPLKNWICYYPVERILAKYTDVLITINKEDYKNAKKLGAKKVVYVPGVGINLERFSKMNISEIRKQKRKELGVSEQSVMILSVGELNKNKNHEVVIKALAQLAEKDFCYFICGQGILEQKLKEHIQKLNLEKKIQLLGFRTDIAELYRAADLFVFPSIREGLSVALMEAMASGLPVVCSEIRGNTDLIVEGKGGFLEKQPDNSDSFTKDIKVLIDNKELRADMGEFNGKKISEFKLSKVTECMRSIYININKKIGDGE